MKWLKINVNPFNRTTDDSVVKALCIALDISWNEAYMSLAKHGIGSNLSMNDKRCWKGFLKYLGYTETKLDNKVNVKYFAENYALNNKVYILQIGSNGATVIKNKTIYDSFNPCNKTVNAFWIIK